MRNSYYNFEGLWFSIYKKVLKLNDALKELKLDKGQLREVATTIFIAQSGKGIVKPYRFTKFQIEIIRMVSGVKDVDQMDAIKRSLKSLLDNGQLKEKEEV